MRRRLFWKIALCFFLTFLAMLQALWFTLFLSGNEPPPFPERLYAERIAPPVVAASKNALVNFGEPGMTSLLEELPREQSERLDITAGDRSVHRATVLGDRAIQAVATSPDGQKYRISYRYQSNPPDNGPVLIAPPQFILIGLAGALLFSAALAWYLTAPINRLRDGFHRLAQGDLEVRVGAAIGRRRDEIADLGRDFDLMAQRLKQLATGRERLLHDVSHELRSPLARIQLAIGLARQDRSRTDEWLSRIDSEALRLNELVGELLTLTRSESGQMSEKQFFDPVGIIEKVAEDARFEASSINVRVSLIGNLYPADDRALMMGDAELLRRALDNVVRNAMRFSASDETVEICVDYDDRRQIYFIEIHDDGPGVPPEDLAALFDPFVRGDDEGAGLGLGLSIAARAIMAHGGTIAALNRPTGGLNVAIELPALHSDG